MSHIGLQQIVGQGDIEEIGEGGGDIDVRQGVGGRGSGARAGGNDHVALGVGRDLADIGAGEEVEYGGLGG